MKPFDSDNQIPEADGDWREHAPAELLRSLETGEEIHSDYELVHQTWKILRLRALADCERVAWRLDMGGMSSHDPKADERSLWYGQIDVVKLVKDFDGEPEGEHEYFEIYWVPSVQGLAIGTNCMGGELHLPKKNDWASFRELITTSGILIGGPGRDKAFALIQPWNCPRLTME